MCIIFNKVYSLKRNEVKSFCFYILCTSQIRARFWFSLSRKKTLLIKISVSVSAQVTEQGVLSDSDPLTRIICQTVKFKELYEDTTELAAL